MNKIQQPKSTAVEPTPEKETLSAPSQQIQTDAEIERLRAENTSLQSKLRMVTAREVMTGSLISAGARSPDLLLAAAASDLQLADNGEPQNAAAIVAELKRRFPEQFGYHRPSASIDAAAGTLASAQTLSAESLARMTPSQVQKLNWDDVRRVISES